MKPTFSTFTAAALLAGVFSSTALTQTPLEPDMVQFADDTFEFSEVHPD